MDGGQHLDQRRLAGAVLADDGVNLAFVEGQVDALQRVRRAEALVELFQDEDRGARGRATESTPAMVALPDRLFSTPAK